jgi:CRP-like cAMP-binding protein
MKDRRGIVSSSVIAAHEILPLLQQVPLFASVAESELECLDQAALVSAPADTTVIAQNDAPCSFWILLTGELRVTRVERDGGTNLLFHIEAGDTFGEAPLMVGTPIEPAQIETVSDSTLLRVSADAFWQLMASCPTLRSAAVANMARRLEIYQALTLHRQNLISLGMLSAGLMHELNNPGAAALRASSQLRSNLTRLQQISLRLTREQFTTEQTDYLVDLQEQALSAQSRVSIESLEQADAEGSLMKWLDEMGVEEAWQIAPTLVDVGWSRSNLEGARQVLTPNLLSDTLHWLEALLSSLR